MALDLADHIFSAIEQLRFHPTAKHVRARAGEHWVVDSTRARIVWEPRRIVPSYAVPLDDIAASLEATESTPTDERPVTIGAGPPVLDPGTGFSLHTTPGQTFDIVAAGSTLAGAAFTPADPDLADYAIVDFDAFDEWREEDELLVGHARDPFTTIDTRRSSRHVVVEVGGTVVADTTGAVMLFETYLPTRYYLPPDDVRMDLLHPTPTTTVCAYKGQASYWSVSTDATTIRDVAWSYAAPHNYAVAVKDMLAFFDERVDTVVDGQRLPRPHTPWS